MSDPRDTGGRNVDRYGAPTDRPNLWTKRGLAFVLTILALIVLVAVLWLVIR
jgi:hypothetical protein